MQDTTAKALDTLSQEGTAKAEADAKEAALQANSSDPTAKPYIPVDTDLVDNLEHYTLDKIRVRISFIDHTGTTDELNGLIAEVYTKDHQEFLRMDDGREMRLDQIKETVPHDKAQH